MFCLWAGGESCLFYCRKPYFFPFPVPIQFNLSEDIGDMMDVAKGEALTLEHMRKAESVKLAVVESAAQERMMGFEQEVHDQARQYLQGEVAYNSRMCRFVR